MSEPQKTAVAPQKTETAPQKTAVAPQKTAIAPQKTAVVPQKTAAAPQKTMASPVTPGQAGTDAPQGGTYSPGSTVKAGNKSYTVERLLGSGAEGDIYIVSDRKTRYALKRCHDGFHTNTAVMPALQSLKGKGYLADIVDYDDSFELSEYLPEGSAAGAGLKGNAQAILAIAVKTAIALDQMHKAGVIHKDIKPANILIRNKGTWDSVLCDFGIADLLNSRGTCTTPQVRTPIYAAPEVYGKGNTIFKEGITWCELTPKADFYSLGMTILSLWMGEGAFLSKEAEMAIDKTKGRIAPPPDMPDPLAKICRGLLIKNEEKRWDLDKIERTIKGENVPVDEMQIIEDLKIVYNASKHLTANTPEELAQCMLDDADLARKYLYRGQIERWLKPYPEIALEVQEIVEKRYPTKQDTGVWATIYTLNPSLPVRLSGISRETGEVMARDAVLLKDVSDFCNEALPDTDTANLIGSDRFKEWVRVRNKALADGLPRSGTTPYVYMLRVQTIDPLSDINLINDPSNPMYAMTQEGIGRFLNLIYTFFWSVCVGDLGSVAEIWNREDNAPYNHQIPAALIEHIAANFLTPEDHHYVTDFFDTKGQRFKKQRSWFVYCTDRNSDDYRRKAGPKDDVFRTQAAWMKVIKGYGVTPEYDFLDGSEVATDLKSLFSHSKKSIREEYNDYGLRGFLAVQHQEDPDADLSEAFAYEQLLMDYLGDLRKIDGSLVPVKRFDEASGQARDILSSGKARVRGLSVRSTIQHVLTIVLAILPGLILLAMLIFSIIENPVLDMGNLKLEKFFWPIGIIVAVILFFANSEDGCLMPIIGGAIASVVIFFLIRFLGSFVLYLFAALVLAVLIFFSIKTVFFHSKYARDARKFTKPGFDEKVLEPLYYAFNDDRSFSSSLQGAFNDDDIRWWKDDLKRRRGFIIAFIVIVWVLGAFSFLIPKSERFDRYSAPFLQKVQSWMPEREVYEPLLSCPTLQQGDRGEDVVKLQKFLREHGYTKNAPDGDFGPGTKKVVQTFQRANGLNVTGVADAETIAKINEIAEEEERAARKAAKEAEKAAQSETTESKD